MRPSVVAIAALCLLGAGAYAYVSGALPAAVSRPIDGALAALNGSGTAPVEAAPKTRAKPRPIPSRSRSPRRRHRATKSSRSARSRPTRRSRSRPSRKAGSSRSTSTKARRSKPATFSSSSTTASSLPRSTTSRPPHPRRAELRAGEHPLRQRRRHRARPRRGPLRAHHRPGGGEPPAIAPRQDLDPCALRRHHGAALGFGRRLPQGRRRHRHLDRQDRSGEGRFQRAREGALADLSVGLPIEVAVDAYPGRVFTGEISTRSPRRSTSTAGRSGSAGVCPIQTACSAPACSPASP